ncbi:MAG: TIGR03619 family F420-dependent LLM class oxidoreductase [Acetobacteraceae bacterium]|nr:TIGR03619 family F420-dependent LLM class oxidoreductase [Acetobacteraceae bacterium]
MQFGFNLPISGPMSEPVTMARLAREGEALGYDYVTLTDHLILPDAGSPGYPYSESGAFYGSGPERRHELLATAAWLAARTERLRLVTAVLVVPHRPAVLAAKTLATIDVLSGGRLTVGVGAGWLKTEFDAAVTTPFAERGAVTDEYIDAFRTLWTEARPRFVGKYVRLPADMVFEPKPIQQPYPPIWVGGEAGPSMRRAARVADAWYPIGTNNKHLLDTLPRLSAGIEQVKRLTVEAGRDPASLGVVYRVKRYGSAVASRASDGERRLFSGSDADVLADLRALRQIGVSGLDFDFEWTESADRALAEMRRFREAVLARV